VAAALGMGRRHRAPAGFDVGDLGSGHPLVILGIVRIFHSQMTANAKPSLRSGRTPNATRTWSPSRPARGGDGQPDILTCGVQARSQAAFLFGNHLLTRALLAGKAGVSATPRASRSPSRR